MKSIEKEAALLNTAKMLFLGIMGNLPENKRLSWDELEEHYKVQYKQLAAQAIILSPSVVWDHFNEV